MTEVSVQLAFIIFLYLFFFYIYLKTIWEIKIIKYNFTVEIINMIVVSVQSNFYLKL